jgi:hypothetical protein
MSPNTCRASAEFRPRLGLWTGSNVATSDGTHTMASVTQRSDLTSGSIEVTRVKIICHTYTEGNIGLSKVIVK